MSDTDPTPDTQAAGDPDEHGYTSNGVDPAWITALWRQSYVALPPP